MRRRRPILLPAAIASLLATGISMLVAGGPTALAASASTSLHDVLAQLRRNAKVSERLNAGFFRAPQTRSFTGSAFHPTDSNTAFSVSTADGSLSLKPEQLSVTPGTTTTTTTTTSTSTTSSSTVTTSAQATGTFEVPLDVPNRAQVVEVDASYSDSKGNNTSPAGKLAPSGFNFEIVRFGQLGESPVELLSQPTGIRSTDGRKGTDKLALAANGFRADNSRYRYVMRVTITDTNAATKLYGFTVQYVIGKGVPGAPA